MRTHPFRVIPFLAAAIFTMVLVAWALQTTNLLDAGQLSVVAPVTLIVLGVAGVAATLRRKS